MYKNGYEALTVQDDALKIIGEFFSHEKQGDREARSRARIALKKYLVETMDGSYTLKSNIFNGKSETMHTHHGAISEALEKFIKPAHLEEKKKISVLDVCSGLGYNAAGCIEFLNDDVEIELDMVEISKETLAIALLLDSPFESYDMIKVAVEDKLHQMGLVKFKFYKNTIPPRININLHIGDVRKVVQEFESNKKFDAIFLDPFSPPKSPELYSYEFFTILKSLLGDDGVILTYTSAAPVRSAMVKSGLEVGEGPSFGRSGGTIASSKPDLIENPLSVEDERMIALSDVGTPFRDPDLKDTSHSILQRREKERETLRGKSKFASTVKTPIYLSENLEDGRLKRRVLKNLQKLGFKDLDSFKSRYVVCPQYHNCICGRGCKTYYSPSERIIEMSHRLRQLLIFNVINSDFF